MSFSNLSASCAGAMRIFAERDTIELKRRVDRLELELYHAHLPPLGNIMRLFNTNAYIYYEEEDCRCRKCFDEERLALDLEEEDVIDDNECKFVPRWNAFIDSIGASVEVGARRPVNIRDHHCDSEAAIFTNDRSKWSSRFSEWGKPLCHISRDLRRTMWDTMVQKVDLHWKRQPWDGVVRDCADNCQFGDYGEGCETYDGSRCRCKRCACGTWVPLVYFEIHGRQCGRCAQQVVSCI